ncbi:Holliday junction resolvase [Candidatus Woesearchaeota archaeon CG11_big_fil_rev_8_21_14_0_20_43_8]|nr:MAG: Holliday junction resolvase [Candidatus Woesearchaeota archaeon CG11_big_fil_rev_8_21_14_0_20_43_8]PIO08986.1 MAG: Holliday junction resolvase [Candidatus Woesearchaeota archaeon CG08_land_8_20_14_0_20_43_7]
MIRTKDKGSAAERELIHMFWENSWAAMRAAGSGSTQHPSPDVIAGNGMRRVAIECKSVGDDKKYISKDEMIQLLLFSHTFGAEAWIGIRFSGRKWFFLNPEDLSETDKSHLVSEKIAEMKGLSFEEMINGF